MMTAAISTGVVIVIATFAGNIAGMISLPLALLIVGVVGIIAIKQVFKMGDGA